MLKAIPLLVATVIIPFASYIDSPTIAKTPTSYHISQNTTQSTRIRYDRIGVGGVTLSMSEKQVRKILGKPVKVADGFVGIIGKTRTLTYSGITVDLAEGSKPGNFSVYEIKATASKYATPDGIKIGDKQDKLIRTYGRIESSKEGNLTQFNYSIDKPSPTSFIFTVKNGKVIQIHCMDVFA
ncbi:hypothetical protein G7B40_023875 [Aetokthonos hydrillicola Thurmond2011]|jgi:hypothetical protein|uniref:Uncharacterized protein n=1 Tax=Aetokthonos hydrillicola Thurmond2011 TaxID=2712845 RepID=A0AAP5ICN7_9CYAN|nr:hypothetical protein [Aetokthonos hydrillicola]MBO3460210.1 hypothetical protein [Aetokthonos hydrillicola CCALA 1050]MBW4586943.1 hypothetical protein [Aetokthonos hydrillicola CCALA 1050]MDR9897582.1 hypothetical protein [Aetokthonos hydrillicola Thurmond2011]